MRVRDCARREVARWTNSEGRLPLRVGRRDDKEVSIGVVAIFVAHKNWIYKMLTMLIGSQASRCTEVRGVELIEMSTTPSQFDALDRKDRVMRRDYDITRPPDPSSFPSSAIAASTLIT